MFFTVYYFSFITIEYHSLKYCSITVVRL